MRKGILLSVLFPIFCLTAYTQHPSGKIYLNNKQLRTANLDHFDFQGLTTKLTKEGKNYLNGFGAFYAANKTGRDSIKIVLDPALTVSEYKVVDNPVGTLRAWAVHNYLQSKFGIRISNALTTKPKMLSSELRGIVGE